MRYKGEANFLQTEWGDNLGDAVIFYDARLSLGLDKCHVGSVTSRVNSRFWATCNKVRGNFTPRGCMNPTYQLLGILFATVHFPGFSILFSQICVLCLLRTPVVRWFSRSRKEVT